MKKRPILIVCTGYIIGILWGLYCKCNIVLLYVFIILSKYITKKVRRKRHKFRLLSFSRYIKYIKIFIDYNSILILIISSFISFIVLKSENKKYDNLYKDVQDISGIARVIDNGKEEEYFIVYTIKIEKINSNNKYKETKLLIKIKKEEKIEYGDRIYFFGEYKEPEIQKNPGGFSYKEYLKTKKIYGTVKVEKLRIIDKKSNNIILQQINSLFLKIKENINKTYSNNESNLVLGIILGDTDEIAEDTKENFKRSGMAHILAVSGMHIMYIICGISYVLCSKIGKRNTKIVTILILILYMCLTNFSPSVVRARNYGNNNISVIYCL